MKNQDGALDRWQHGYVKNFTCRTTLRVSIELPPNFNDIFWKPFLYKNAQNYYD